MEATAIISESSTVSTPPAGTQKRAWISALLILIAMAPLFIWPEDVAWGIDEPRLVAAAYHSNQAGELAVNGLYGNFGVCYGPVPTQIYQLLLLFTHDPFTLVILRALLAGSITAMSLYWLGRTLNLPLWFAACILIAPQITNHHRVLWDASFTIPLSTLAIAAFASFIQTRRPGALRIAVWSAMELPLIHPQSLPIAIPILGYLLWKHRADLWKDRRGLLWTIGFLVLLNAKYFFIAAFNVVWRVMHGSAASYPGQGSRLVSALAPLYGGKLLNGYDYTELMARPPGPDWLVTTMATFGLLAYPLIWIGIVSLLGRVPAAFRRLKANSASTLDAMAVLGAAALCCQALIFGGLRIPLGPQYYFGTFGLHAMLAWLGVDYLRKLRFGGIPFGNLAGAAFGLGCAYITVGDAWVLHNDGYKYQGWPTLRNAVEVAQSLNQFPDEAAYTDIDFLKKYPQGFRSIRLLLPPASAKFPHHNGRPLITYEGKSGIMVVKEFSGTKPPENFAFIGITPLPDAWVPDPSIW